jgi:Uri superfamily endonuclease
MTRSVRDALFVRLQRLGGLPLTAHTPMPAGGSYLIALEIERDIVVAIGARGRCALPRGFYLYAGNARRGLQARIERHLRPVKKKRWHIDYLTSRREVRPLTALVFTERDVDECHLIAQLLRIPGAGAPVPGFGASDCRRRCPAHLVRLA